MRRPSEHAAGLAAESDILLLSGLIGVLKYLTSDQTSWSLFSILLNNA